MKYKYFFHGIAVVAILIVGAFAVNHYTRLESSSRPVYKIASNPVYFNKFKTSNVTEEMMNNPEYFDLFTTTDTGLGVGMSGGGGGSDFSSLTITTTAISNGVLTVTNLTFPGGAAADTNLDTTAFITAKVTKNTSYTITISDGNNYSFGTTSQRDLADGSSNYLSYEVYKDSTHTSRWGTSSSEDVNGTGNGTNDNYTAYGRVASVAWTVPAGTYTDTLSVTLTF